MDTRDRGTPFESPWEMLGFFHRDFLAMERRLEESVREEIKKAVAAKVEECARIAEGFCRKHTDLGEDSLAVVAAQIAYAIRRGLPD